MFRSAPGTRKLFAPIPLGFVPPTRLKSLALAHAVARMQTAGMSTATRAAAAGRRPGAAAAATRSSPRVRRRTAGGGSSGASARWRRSARR
eukprot:3965631-Prymnesium_polylepis.1